MQIFLLLFAFVGASVGATVEAVQTVTLNIQNKQLAPDGFSRSTVVANGVYPNPPILAVKGQTLSVVLNNHLTDTTMRRSTALNLDGIFYSTANIFMEGEPFVNACPVGPGSSFTYQANLAQSGTFWYHSELSIQYVDGFRGPLIVYDPFDPQRNLYDVDNVNTIIQLGEWYHTPSISLLAGYVATGGIPVSDAGTVNGRGRFNGGPVVPWSVISVVKGKRYRFRLISEAVRDIFTVSFDNHNMTIIEADGQATQPHIVKKLDLLAGQRYSVIVNANQPVANYWFNAPFVGGNAAANPNQNGTLSRAILRYAGAPNADPTTPMTLGPDDGALVEADLRPLVPTKVEAPDIQINLTISATAGKAQFNLNGISYVPPKDPTLNRVLEGETDFNVTENTFVLPSNKVVEIAFPAGGGPHPFHMHGMVFQLVKSMTSNVTNLVNPISRDTAGVGGTGTTIRFRTNKAGPFMYHCHIFWHKFAGLATVQMVDPAATRQGVHPSAAWENLCPAYNALPPDQQ